MNNDQLLETSYKFATELEQKVLNGEFVKDYVDEDGERTIVTKTPGGYGYAVYKSGETEPHYVAMGPTLIEDLGTYTDSNGVVLAYSSAKNRIERNLTGMFVEYVKDPGFEAVYFSLKMPKESDIMVSQRMAGYNPQDPVTIYSASFARRKVSIAADVQIIRNENGKPEFRVGLGGLNANGEMDYEKAFRFLREAEMAKGFFGESHMGDVELWDEMVAYSMNSQALFYPIYETFNLPILEGVKPNNLLARAINGEQVSSELLTDGNGALALPSGDSKQNT